MAFDIWKDQFVTVVNYFVTKREIKSSRSAPWLSCDILYAIEQNKIFWRKKVRGSSNSRSRVLEAFRLLRQRIKNWIRSNRKIYFTRIASAIQHNARPFWSFFEPKSNCNSFPDTMYLDGNIEGTSISLLPILSNVAEKCVEFISNRLFALQHGLRHSLSSTTQFLCVLHDIGKALDSGHEIDVIYLDLSRSCHRYRLSFSSSLQTSCTRRVWFTSKLIHGLPVISSWACCHQWYFQFLGQTPFWCFSGIRSWTYTFLLFINDLPDCLSVSRIAMFADDTKCYNVIRFQEDSIFNWALHNELSFQPVKCENLRISRKRKSVDRSYFMNNGKLLMFYVTLVFWSLRIWATHVNSLIAKANKMLGFLRRNCSRHLPLDSQRTLYVCLVRSRLTYAWQLWSPTSTGSLFLMHNMERVQRRATRLIM